MIESLADDRAGGEAVPSSAPRGKRRHDRPHRGCGKQGRQNVARRGRPQDGAAQGVGGVIDRVGVAIARIQPGIVSSGANALDTNMNGIITIIPANWTTSGRRR